MNNFPYPSLRWIARGMLLAGALAPSAVLGLQDITSPTVGEISPNSATANSATTFSATANDLGGIAYCQLAVGGSNYGQMDFVNGVASKSVILTAGSYSVQAQCRDNSNNWGYGNMRTVVVSAASDTQGPTVGPISPTSAGTLQTYSVTYSDPSGVSECRLTPDGNANTQWPMNLSNGVASLQVQLTAGVHGLMVVCKDVWGNSSTVLTNVSVTDAQSAPVVSVVMPNYATVNNTTAFSFTYTNPQNVNACSVYVDGSYYSGIGNFSNGSGLLSLTFTTAGQHQVYVQCRDLSGVWHQGPSIPVTVSSVMQTDTQAPTVGQLSPGQAKAGTAVSFSAPVWDNVGVATCSLYLSNGFNAGMYISNGVATWPSYTFPAHGGYSGYVRCVDGAGNYSNSPTRLIEVAPASSGFPSAGALIKASCPLYALSDHPCKAVYYLGADGKRHAFPNERVFFTWYANFGGVVEVSDIYMAQIGLGKNVTYRPGTRMVKFTTVPKVYAVGLRGNLRWVASESAAVSLYGPNWNTQIDDISDAFYTNYTFGSPINSIYDYNVSTEMQAASSIDANF